LQNFGLHHPGPTCHLLPILSFVDVLWFVEVGLVGGNIDEGKSDELSESIITFPASASRLNRLNCVLMCNLLSLVELASHRRLVAFSHWVF
jgi:hypothetical protein